MFSEASAAESEYNFNWLDPDKKVYVLQNRRYLKAGKPFLSVLGGVGLSNPYRSTYFYDLRGAVYFSESWGLEVFYSGGINSVNNTYLALEQSSPNALPVIREFNNEIGGLLHWVPWYAKINVFNQVLYFDWYLEGGVGQIKSTIDTRIRVSDASTNTTQNFTAFYFGTGHQYHLTENWVVRLDFLGAFYQAMVFGNSGENTWFSKYKFGGGLGYRF